MKNKMLLALLSLSLFSAGSMQSAMYFVYDNDGYYNDDDRCCRHRRSCRSCHRNWFGRNWFDSGCCGRYYYRSYWYGN